MLRSKHGFFRQNKGFIFNDLQAAIIAEHLLWSAGFKVTIPEFSAKDFAVREVRPTVIGTKTVTVCGS